MMRLAALFFALSCQSTNARAQAGPASLPTGTVMLELQDVDAYNVAGLKAKLADLEVDSNIKEVWLRINSHGGSVEAGFDLIQTFDHYRKPLICVVDTKAWSMGMSVLEGCPKRLMTRRSSLMMHEVLVQGMNGNQHDMIDAASTTRVLTESLIQLAASRLKLSANDIRTKVTGKQWWIDADEALDVGAIDGFVEPQDIPSDQLVTLPPPAQSILEILRGS